MVHCLRKMLLVSVGLCALIWSLDTIQGSHLEVNGSHGTALVYTTEGQMENITRRKIATYGSLLWHALNSLLGCPSLSRCFSNVHHCK